MHKAALLEAIQQHFSDQVDQVIDGDMVTVELPLPSLLTVVTALRDEPALCFDTLIDVCGVDYLQYGKTEWRTEQTTASGFSRAVSETMSETVTPFGKPRFAVVYHLLSVEHNHRVRLKVFLEGEPLVPSVIDIWPSANWYEREAFDLFGIVFEGHPDLRRLLTDYGFKGHPFRKDFPLIGEVEMRYDAAQKRCVYEPVSIKPRVLVPKVIRKDSRYKGQPNG